MRALVKSIIALLLLCGIALAQPQPVQSRSSKPKAAVYIMGNPAGRDALRMSVNTFLTKSGMYQMIAVDAIDIVAREHNRQMSGSVSDGDIAALGRDAGAQYVCVVERTELDGVSYVAVRMVSVQSKVAELADMVELPHGERIINIIERLIYSMLGIAYEEEQTQPDAISMSDSQDDDNTSPFYADSHSYGDESESGSVRTAVRNEKNSVKQNAWYKSLSLSMVGIPIMLNRINPFFSSVGIQFMGIGGGSLEYFKPSVSFLRVGLSYDGGFIGRGYDAIKEIYPDVNFDSTKVTMFIKGGAFARLYPMDVFYLSGGVNFGYYGGINVKNASGEVISENGDISAWVFPVGAGFIIGWGSEKDVGVVFDAQYNTVMLKNGNRGYWSFNVGFKVGRW